MLLYNILACLFVIILYELIDGISSPYCIPSKDTNMIKKRELKEDIKKRWKDLCSYFNVASDLEFQNDAEANIRAGVSFKGSQLLVLIFAILIASLGLNTNSIPVIIGAMLISPLMGPIIGMGLAIGIADYALLRRGLKNIIMAVLGSVIASALYFLISPQYGGTSQLLLRTSPSIYDVFIAFFGGAAGIVSITCRNKGEVMPGVAIATSLMPPLCTAGYGLATFQAEFFFGALYLFFTNMIFILFAAWVGVKVIGYNKVVYQDEKKAHRVQTIVFSVICVTIGLSAYLTVKMISKNQYVTKASEFVEKEMVFPNTQVLNYNAYMKGDKKYLNVTLIGEALPTDSLQLSMLNKLDSVGLGGTILHIKQGFAINQKDGFAIEENADRFYALMQTQLSGKQEIIDSLRNRLSAMESDTDNAGEVAPEVKVIFPMVQDIALARFLIASAQSETPDTLNMAFIHAPEGMTASNRVKLQKYLEVRLKKTQIHLNVNPVGFPWPASAKK